MSPTSWWLDPGVWGLLTAATLVAGIAAIVAATRQRHWLAAVVSHPVARRSLWPVNIAVLVLLGTVRVASSAEYYFASLVILPVMATTWVLGRRDGMVLSFLAAAMWTVADLGAGNGLPSPWLPWANGLTRLLTYALVTVLVAEVRTLLARERDWAMHDGLTGLLNRRAFLELGDAESMRSRRYAHSLAIVFIDLDNFKQLNDTRGHPAGDAALRATANALHTKLRLSDSVARLGGDEFAIVLPEIDYAAAVEAGHKISAAIRAALTEFPPVTASVGVAWFDRACPRFDSMVAAADNLMYEVKHSGKGDFVARRLSTEFC
jgi:diguanylate cyclase (GGDEF)-like protein